MHLWVFDQTWQEARKPALFWTAALAAVAWLLVLAWPWLAAWHLPAWSAGFFPAAALHTRADWAGQVVGGWVVPLLVGLYAIALGSWLVAGEEERGSLGLLLASPVRRERLILEKSIVLVAALACVCAGLGLALFLPLWARLGAMTFLGALRSLIALYLLGLASGGLALALGCWTGLRGASHRVALLVLLLALFAARLPQPLPIPAIHWVSPFFYYTGIQHGSPIALLLLVLLALAAFSFAWIGFARRDFRS